MRATWLTWRIHRFEIVFALAVGALLAVSAWVIAEQIRALGLADAVCWPRTEDGDYATAACGQMMEAFWPLEDQSGLVRVGLNVLPVLIGIILGVPVVGRELELRTAGFSWALTASRSRWLVARLVPMALVGVVALGVLALAGRYLFDAIWLGRYGPELTEVATEGAALVLRGLAAFGVGLLLGALVGRTMPALLIGVAVMAAWGLLVVPQAQAQLTPTRTVWVDEGGWRDGVGWLAYTDQGGTFDVSRPGLPGEPGMRIEEQALYESIDAQVRATCGEAPEYGDEDGPGSPEYQAWARCAEPIQAAGEASLSRWNKVVPRSAWPDFSFLDMGMSLVVGLVTLALTFVVVARRRPE